MKNSSFIKLMIFALLMTGLNMCFFSCSSDVEPLTSRDSDSTMEADETADETWLKPIELTNPDAAEVNSYFSDLLNKKHGSEWEMVDKYFVNNKEHRGETLGECIIINSAEQMNLAIPMDTPTQPEIDFSKYTFVLGYVGLSTTTAIYDINKIVLKPTEDGVLIKVPVLSSDFQLCDYWPRFFCNIYPKFICGKEVSIVLVPVE